MTMAATAKSFVKRTARAGLIPVLTLILLLTTGTAATVQAQMFSVDDAPRDGSIPDMAVYAGLEAIDFQYQGASTLQGAAGIYEFSGAIVRLAAEARGLTFYLGTGGKATGLDDVSYFDAGIQAGYGFALHRGENLLLVLPVQLHSGLTRVSNNEMVTPGVPEFQQGALELAGGLELNARPAPRFRITGSVLPSYGFSFSTRERDAGGSIFGLEGKARLFFDHLFGAAGLSVGYSYDLRDYDIDGEFLDYKASGHNVLIGITF